MTYDEEFIKLMMFKTIKVKVETPDSWLELFEKKFPIGLNRIAWDKVEKKKEISLHELSGDKLAMTKKIGDFIENIRVISKIDCQEPIIIISDGALEDIYSTNFSALKNMMEDLFLLPQHTYVIPKDGRWCLNYTFEDDLFFGFSPNLGEKS